MTCYKGSERKNNRKKVIYCSVLKIGFTNWTWFLFFFFGYYKLVLYVLETLRALSGVTCKRFFDRIFKGKIEKGNWKWNWWIGIGSFWDESDSFEKKCFFVAFGVDFLVLCI